RFVSWQPAGHRRKISCKVKTDKDKRQSPPVAAHDAFEADGLTGFRGKFFQVIIQLLVKGLVFDKHIGLEIHGKTEWVQVARTYGYPFVIHQRHLAVKRAFAVFQDSHAFLQQIIVERAAAGADPGHVWLALHDQYYFETFTR